MTLFRNFTVPLWELFAGNLLLFICSLFYLAWWIVAFRPDATAKQAVSGLLITAAFITGIAAIGLMAAGIYSLSGTARGLPVWAIPAGGLVVYLILWPVTSLLLHRPVTSELIILHIWAVLELSVISVLCGIGRLGIGRTAVLAILTGIASIAGLICYMLYYRLDKMASYRTGMIPLITDAGVMAVFLIVFAVA